MHFSPKVDYILILDKLREDFNKKFAVNVPSPSTGLDDYDVKATLGSGSFGKVQLVREKESGVYYASKQLSKDQIVKTKQVSHVMSEKNVLRAAAFPAVPKPFSIIEFGPGTFTYLNPKNGL